MSKVGYIHLTRSGINANKKAIDIVRKSIESVDEFSEFLAEKIGVSLKDILKYLKKVNNKRLDYFFKDENENAFRFSFYYDEENDEYIIVMYEDDKEKLSYDIKQNLMAMVVHDMKTPLSSIKETILLLSEETLGQLNDMQKRCVSIARKEIVKLQKILENLSRVGTFSELSFIENVEKVDIYDFASELIVLLKDKSMKKKVSIDFNLDENKHFYVYGNRKNILNLFYYLGDFAVEYSEKSSINIKFLQRKNIFEYVIDFYSDNAPSEDIFNKMIGNFWNNKETALIRKENICAFSLRLCSFWADTIKAKISYKNNYGKCLLSLSIPE